MEQCMQLFEQMKEEGLGPNKITYDILINVYGMRQDLETSMRFFEQMKEQGLRVIGADPSGTESLPEADLSGPLAWVLGAEGEGMRRLTRERCDRLVCIPMLGRVESLNVSVAAGLCLYETRRQRAGGIGKALERRSM